MDPISSLGASFGWVPVSLAALVLFAGGFAKGAVGFALPMVSVSGLGAIFPAEVAVAGLLLPALLANIWQAFRDGAVAAWQSLRKFAVFTAMIVGIIALVSPLVPYLPSAVFLLILGCGVTSVALLQLSGWRPSRALADQPWMRFVAATFAGVFGGLAAVTGPAVVIYLLALDTPKGEQMRVQGLIFLIGLLVLVGVHSQNGILNPTTFTLSALLVVPAFAGMALGLWVNARLDQQKFRTATLVVLVIAGLNLLRRALAG